MMMKNETKIDLISDFSDNAFDMKDFENPVDLMEKVLQDVNEAFETLYDNYSMSYDEFYIYVQFHNDDLSKEIDQLWDSIDCDIYNHYEQGTLLSFELCDWKLELFEWKEKIFAAIRDIVKAEYFEDFRTGFAHSAYVNAA